MRHGASVSAPWMGRSASWVGSSLGSLRGRSVSAIPSLALLGPPPKPPPPVLLASLSCRCLAVLLRGLELTRQCLLGLGGRPHPELLIVADGKGNGHMGSLHGLPLLCMHIVRRRDNPGGRLLTPQRASALHEHPTGELFSSPAHVTETSHGSCNVRVYPILS